jgi:hypothetical protein
MEGRGGEGKGRKREKASKVSIKVERRQSAQREDVHLSDVATVRMEEGKTTVWSERKKKEERRTEKTTYRALIMATAIARLPRGRWKTPEYQANRTLKLLWKGGESENEKTRKREKEKRRKGEKEKRGRKDENDAPMSSRQHQEHGKVPWTGCGSCRSDDKSGHADEEGNREVNRALGTGIAKEGVLVGDAREDEGDDGGEDVRRGGEEEGVNAGVAEGLHDGGEELGDSARGCLAGGDHSCRRRRGEGKGKEIGGNRRDKRGEEGEEEEVSKGRQRGR